MSPGKTLYVYIFGRKIARFHLKCVVISSLLPYTEPQVQTSVNNHGVFTFKKEITSPKQKVYTFHGLYESQIPEANITATPAVSTASTQMLLLETKQIHR
jgi:hypothetical protein